MGHNKELPFLDSQIIHASQKDRADLSFFLNQNIRLHRHLDWFGVLDWLGSQPFLIEKIDDRILAILCAVNENPTFSWIRAFGIRKSLPTKKHWTNLMTVAKSELLQSGLSQLGALGLNPWFEDLLTDSGFYKDLDILSLAWDGELPSEKKSKHPVTIRQMQKDDLSAIKQIDELAFSAPWQNSKEALIKAFKQPGVSTVATIDNAPVGYQISTTMTIYGHLARLAVIPELQHQGIGYVLVDDLLKRLSHQGLWRITVNTQSDNLPSLNLYQRFGFKPTGEKIAVYQFDL
ncbi:MAG: GNAT family N-acetyltransferase [Brevefilum sp.]|jgi:ribosomal protein S18 acetylase RimI-like enzyme